MSEKTPATTAEEWDALRERFQASIMVDVSLDSLAQNVGITGWPLKGKDETPAKYINYSFVELKLMPSLNGKPERVDLLADILRETMAFDDPFGDMVDQVEATSSQQDDIEKNLNRLGIPEEFPIFLTNIDQDAKDFCRREEITTVGEFVNFSKGMSQAVVVGGDFRALLNALAQPDEAGLAKFLPFRPGKTGIHLVEAIGLVVESLEDREKAALRKDFGGTLIPGEDGGRPMSTDDVEGLKERVHRRLDAMMEWFGDEKQQIADRLQDPEYSLDRYFVVFDHPRKEFLCRNLLEEILERDGLISRPSRQKGGVFGALGRLFGRK